MNQVHNQDLRKFQVSVGMTVTLISFGMMFATMFLGYFLLRFNAAVWPPVEIEGLPKLLPFLSTVVIGLSSVTYYYFEKSKKSLYWSLTVLLGLGFLALQALLWSELKATGIFVQNGMVPSMVYAFTGLHAAHILLAIFTLLWLGYFVFRRPQGLSELRLLNVGKFWHFLGVVWLLMYLTIFVL